MSTTDNSEKTPSPSSAFEDANIKILHEARAMAVSNAIKKTGIGMAVGAAASLGVFRRKRNRKIVH